MNRKDASGLSEPSCDGGLSLAMDDPSAHGTIDARETITEIQVSDLSRSREWYSRLFGKRVDLEPFEGNLEWKIAGAWVQITQGAPKPSSWGLRIEVRDIQQERERLRRAGIAAKEVKTVPDTIAFFGVRDPDDQDLLFFQVLSADPKITGGRA
jgi:predicted enzyme related to lactoylglutathione lyase